MLSSTAGCRTGTERTVGEGCRVAVTSTRFGVWAAAALAVLCAACTASNGQPAAPPSSPVQETPSSTMQAGEVGASGDVVAGAQGAIVTSKDLRVEDGTVLLTFPRLPHPPSCLDSLELRMRVAGGGGTTLGAYPSIESTAHELADGDALGGTLLRSNRPRSTADVSAAGQVAVWDVLPHYGADIFMRSTTADPDDHFALAVRPLTANDSRDVTFDAAESGDGPLLSWTASLPC